MKVIVASTNPVKIESSKLGFVQMFPGMDFEFEGVKASSRVADQPLSGEETLLGAKNRVAHAKELSPLADFYVGLEGGVEDIEGELHEFAWIFIQSSSGRTGKSKTSTFIAPPIFRKMIIDEGKEIGDASDIVFGQTNSKQKMGAAGLLTKGVIDRAEFYRHAVVFALVPFIHKDLY